MICSLEHDIQNHHQHGFLWMLTIISIVLARSSLQPNSSHPLHSFQLLFIYTVNTIQIFHGHRATAQCVRISGTSDDAASLKLPHRNSDGYTVMLFVFVRMTACANCVSLSLCKLQSNFIWWAKQWEKAVKKIHLFIHEEKAVASTQSFQSFYYMRHRWKWIAFLNSLENDVEQCMFILFPSLEFIRVCIRPGIRRSTDLRERIKLWCWAHWAGCSTHSFVTSRRHIQLFVPRKISVWSWFWLIYI